MAFDECLIDGAPGQAGAVLNYAVIILGPTSTPFVERIGPSEDLAYVEDSTPRFRFSTN